MSVSVREFVVDELALPETWRVVDEQRVPSTIDRETVVVKHDRIEKLSQAPLGAANNNVIVGVFIPNKDLARAEIRMDAAVVQLLAAVDRHPSIGWTEAQKVVTPNGQYPGWEITLTVITETTTDKE